MQRGELNSAWPFLQQGGSKGGSKGAGHPFWGSKSLFMSCSVF